MGAQALDSFFSRTVAATTSGWGAGTDGQSWGVATGTATYAVASNVGTVTGINSTATTFIGSKTLLNSEQVVRVSITKSTASAVGLVARATAGNTFYRARLRAGLLEIHYVNAGTGTLLASQAFTLAVGSTYNLRFHVQGRNLYARAWAADGSTVEPSTWVSVTNDTNIQTAGQIGVTVNPNSLTEISSFDSYYCDDLVDSPYAITYFVNGGSANNPQAPSGTLPQQLIDDMSGPYSCNLSGYGANAPTNAPNHEGLVPGGPMVLRLQLNWYQLETDSTNPRHYNWNYLDDVVSRCNMANIDVMMALQLAPQWRCVLDSQNNNVGSTSGILPTPSDMANFATDVASRYNGSVKSTATGMPMYIKYLQVGNEEYDTKGTRTSNTVGKATSYMAAYAANAAIPAILAVHPTCKTVIAAVRKTPTNATTHITNWTTQCYNALTVTPFGVDAHYYRSGSGSADPTTSVGSPDNVPSVDQEVTIINTSLSNASLSSVAIFFMETGWQYLFPANVTPAVTTTLTSNITSTANGISFTIASGSGFPTSNFYVTIDNETLIIASRSGTTCTVDTTNISRGYYSTGSQNDNTNPATHTSGATVQLVSPITQAQQSQYLQSMFNQGIVGGATSGKNVLKMVGIWTLDYLAGNTPQNMNFAQSPSSLTASTNSNLANRTYQQAFGDLQTLFIANPSWAGASLAASVFTSVSQAAPSTLFKSIETWKAIDRTFGNASLAWNEQSLALQAANYYKTLSLLGSTGQLNASGSDGLLQAKEANP